MQSPEAILTLAEEHVRLYRVATLSSVTRAVCPDQSQSARAALQGLVEKGTLVRHVSRYRKSGFEYFTLAGDTCAPRALRRRLAVLHFSCGEPTLKPLLPPSQFKALVGVVAAEAGLRCPEWRPCYLHRANRQEPLRLSLIRVGVTAELQEAVAQIDSLVAAPTFRPWSYFAGNGHFILTYLLPASQAKADELGRWLRRRPPLYRFGSTSTSVRVFVRAFQLREVA